MKMFLGTFVIICAFLTAAAVAVALLILAVALIPSVWSTALFIILILYLSLILSIIVHGDELDMYISDKIVLWRISRNK